MPQIDRYAVFGHPIGHSQSPRIHTLFAAQTGQVLTYAAQDVPAEDFETAAREFFVTGGKGLNCTVPLKELAFAWTDQLSERAVQAKAVNTLALRPDGAVFGDNTDGEGLVRDLTGNLGLGIEGRRILLLGAGGAGRGVLAPLLALAPERLVIANRTVAKAEILAGEFGDLGPVVGCGFADLAGESFDLILNATAASLGGEVPDLPGGLLAAGGSCYDLAYGKEPTSFVRWGKAAGAALSMDGIGMLVEQAAAAFELWRGVRPATRSVIAALNAGRGLAA
ncbi:shikimate dehydrogenase [Methylomagnum ishizawai]|uniref:Shikimate dehydrogenase (NADP(+)) n=1 Tax=Methylomagnum ishizawai TaxID=1760988 RepID=A0A1Y6CZT1_9GAMM|nr:shikimate dehydrogenase [Methylomagnum ishizawai]SMF93654.1 shikimate dehydrogenase [Methylomagnum ishizawai]